MFKLKLRIKEKPFVKTRFTPLFICVSILIIVTKTTKNTNLAVIITLTTLSLIILTVSDIVHNGDNRRVPYGRITYKDEKPSFLSLVKFSFLEIHAEWHFSPTTLFPNDCRHFNSRHLCKNRVREQTNSFSKTNTERLVVTYFVMSL